MWGRGPWVFRGGGRSVVPVGGYEGGERTGPPGLRWFCRLVSVCVPAHFTLTHPSCQFLAPSPMPLFLPPGRAVAVGRWAESTLPLIPPELPCPTWRLPRPLSDPPLVLATRRQDRGRRSQHPLKQPTSNTTNDGAGERGAVLGRGGEEGGGGGGGSDHRREGEGPGGGLDLYRESHSLG